MEALHRIGDIDDLPDRGGINKIAAQPFPVIVSELGNGGILPPIFPPSPAGCLQGINPYTNKLLNLYTSQLIHSYFPLRASVPVLYKLIQYILIQFLLTAG